MHFERVGRGQASVPAVIRFRDRHARASSL